jgi:hypothetical protein
MATCEHDGKVCETCGAWVLWGYQATHEEFHKEVTGLLLKVSGVCPSCRKPYDEPSCEADHSEALLERWDVMNSALQRGPQVGRS